MRSPLAGSRRLLLHVASWPYVLLGCGYAALAVGLIVVGAPASTSSSARSSQGGMFRLRYRTVGLFTVAGVALVLLTIVLVIAQT